MKHILLFLLFTISLSSSVVAQEQNEHEKSYHVDSLNKYYIQAELPLYFHVSTSPDAKPVQLAGKQDTDPKYELRAMYLDGHGKHIMRHYDSHEKVGYNIEIYADGIAPKTKSFFQTENLYSTKEGTYYYGKDFSVRLDPQDELSGVQELFHSINGDEYSTHSETTVFDKEGSYEYKFYAVDKVGNREEAQNFPFIVDLTAPATYYNIIGIAKDEIVSISTKIYLTPEDSLSGIKNTYWKIDNQEYKRYTGNNIPFTNLEDGYHTLYFYSVDQVNNEEKENSFKFYLDKTAPIMSADVLGDKFIVGDQVYFSGRTKLKLTAVDNKSGIKEVLFSVDGEEFKRYDQPFYLPSKSGEHVIKYFAVDNLANTTSGKSSASYQEYRHNVNKVYVDLTGPIMSYKYEGPMFKKGSTIFINGETKIKLTGKDPESGLQKITYSINGNTVEQEYADPFSIENSGVFNLNYFGYDNVNNRNVSNFAFVVDNDGPEVYHHYSVKPSKTVDGIDYYPPYVALFLAATDELTGYKDIFYSINDGVDKVYDGIIMGFDAGKTYDIKLHATDKLGNKTEKSFVFAVE